MTRRTTAALVMISALALAGSALAEEGDAGKGKKVFNKCKVCHQVGENAKKKVGPVLNGVIGAEAGAREGFKYSAAMKVAGENGMVWDDANIDKYLEKPRKFIPKNKMAFAGLRKEADRKNVIAYLKQFTPSK